MQALTLAAALAAVGCASGDADPVVKPVMQRLAATEANPDARKYAAGPLSEAASALKRAEDADEPALRRHFAYLAGKNLDIADALVARRQAEVAPAEKAAAAPAPDQEPEKRRSRAGAGAAPSRAQADAAEQTEQAVGAAREPTPAERNLIREMERERQQSAARDAGPESPSAAPPQDTPPQTMSPVVVEVPGLQFAAGATALTPGHKRRLEPLVLQMRELPGLNIVVEGYTDNAAGNEAGLEVSLKRAAAVKAFLTEQGISPDRIRTLGLGAGYPVASNDTPAGRSQNRRVEIVVSPGALNGPPLPRGSSPAGGPEAADTGSGVTPPRPGESATPPAR